MKATVATFALTLMVTLSSCTRDAKQADPVMEEPTKEIVVIEPADDAISQEAVEEIKKIDRNIWDVYLKSSDSYALYMTKGMRTSDVEKQMEYSEAEMDIQEAYLQELQSFKVEPPSVAMYMDACADYIATATTISLNIYAATSNDADSTTYSQHLDIASAGIDSLGEKIVAVTYARLQYLYDSGLSKTEILEYVRDDAGLYLEYEEILDSYVD